jgi:hypothetical protein
MINTANETAGTLGVFCPCFSGSPGPWITFSEARIARVHGILSRIWALKPNKP